MRSIIIFDINLNNLLNINEDSMKMRKVVIISDLEGIFKIKIDIPGPFQKNETDKELYDERYLKRIFENIGI